MSVQRLDPETVFHVARQKLPHERAAYLDAACSDDPAVRQRVEQMLAAQAEIGSFLEAPAPELGATHDLPQVTERPGTVVGPYKLLEEIGEGGFGVVFMAEQTHPVRRKVALKVIKPGMDTRLVVARFEAERQALALMDHPNIAKVHDAGATDAGRPFFVMELVKGIPITKYCDEHRLTPRQRLELFVPVCHAIQHAHQKGIIHRDVKPSNVPVALYDDKPVPKVIDFGVAKATGQQLTEQTLHTGFGAVVGTVEYMSPEQASFNQLDVDTRSDVYSLGVLLYELLAGSPPFRRKETDEVGLLETLRVIREQEPPKPSAKLSTADGLPTLAANRGTEPAKLTRLVRGELDWIVMKALEKDRSRRYETANAFAMDVERYLADEPVQACPPSRWYRLRKLVRRNKGAATVAVLLTAALGALVAGSTVATVLIWRAYSAESSARSAESAQLQRARQNMELFRDALDRIYLRVAEERFPRDPQREREDRELLAVALDFYERFARENQGERTAQAEVAYAYHRVGEIHLKLGRLPEAKAALGRAVELREQLVADFPTFPVHRHQLGASHTYVGMVSRAEGDQAGAAESYRRALDVQAPLVAEFPAEPNYRDFLAMTHHNCGNQFNQVGDRNKAVYHHKEALTLRAGLAADFPDRPEYQRLVALSHSGLGSMYARRKEWAAAAEHIDRGIAILDRLVEKTPDDPACRIDLAHAHGRRAELLMDRNDPTTAAKHHRRAADLFAKLASEFPTVPRHRMDHASALLGLGVSLKRSGDRAGAEHVRNAHDLFAKLAAEFPAAPSYRRFLASSHLDLGNVAGDPAAAVEHYSKAIDLQTALVVETPAVPEVRHDLAQSRYNLALALQGKRDPAAVDQYRKALDVYGGLAAEFPAEPDYRWGQARCLGNLSNIHVERNDPEAAADYLRQAIAIREKLAADFAHVPQYRQELARSHSNMGMHLRSSDPEASLGHYRRARELQEELFSASPENRAYAQDLAMTLGNIAWPFKQKGDLAQAEELGRRALDLRMKLSAESPKSPIYLHELGATQHNLALTLADKGELTEARGLFERAIDNQRQALAAQPKHRFYRQFLRNHHSSLAYTLIRLGDHGEAVKVAGALPSIIPDGWEEYYRAAQYVARCVPLAAKDDHLAPDQRQELTESYAERAMELARQAVQRGFKDVERLKKDPDLDSLRSRPDFKKLQTELAAPVKN